ncbi:hypothetical protein [Plebeiibacterium sediminum]|uniref:Twin-arginine translocation signal domain-containing protein n=1 Tax=Plebeiibacterium sediminum TaxID=2992112 RepID=A0AAE3SEM2_9BACT|nr:hypothetical protein [Plebeiobacterium sediminum]MCW3785268.1 hypothetical protein [Plebeiobacterium sediminum]
MDSNKINKQKISRKSFLQMAGSVIAGGTIIGTTGYLIGNRINASKNESEGLLSNNDAISNEPFQSPYKLVSSFSTSDEINGFEIYKNQMVVATSNNIAIYNSSAQLKKQFSIAPNLRDISVENDSIYLLFPSRIMVYNFDGDLKNEWEACGENSDYCSIAASPYHLFVTDASNKNICQYTIDGQLERFIESPNRFIIPSYTFGITYANNSIYCSNPGRHCVERYSVKGQYLGSFGEPGNAPGKFCGCCNPVYIDYTSAGEIITSEKGNPRISCYDSEGNFRNMLLDVSKMGGGNKAYRVKVDLDKIMIAGNNMVSTFQYDKTLANKSGCSSCGINCPLKEGITI